MDMDTQVAASTTEAPVTESAPVEESTVETNIETTEKSETTNEVEQDNPTEGVADDKGQLIPKDRFDEVLRERNELRELKAKLEAERQEQERMASMTPEDQAQQEQMLKAKEALKKLGVITQEDFQQLQQQEAAKNMFVSEMNRLSAEYNGKNGLPKFEPQEVAKYMDEMMSKGQHITDPETAYKLKYYDAIIDAKAKSQKSTAYAEKQAGGVQEVNDTRDSELEAAAESGKITDFIKKYAPMPK
jgi:hypothetical protein